ncbi:hypothetical protein NW762_002393 [Fusarium torreyae]|uniref:Uncharacterized protein n=1 Tax=Fusarium torreyae TaxID=1237075 RepID=A0A9W8SAP2_9HYPO|nr:hypothetical protein NW762_002393 [Fusarium torreyae]
MEAEPGNERGTNQSAVETSEINQSTSKRLTDGQDMTPDNLVKALEAVSHSSKSLAVRPEEDIDALLQLLDSNNWTYQFANPDDFDEGPPTPAGINQIIGMMLSESESRE